MRVLMVLGQARGGIGAHVDRLVADLRAMGHHVEVVTAESTAAAFGWRDAHRLWPVHPGLRAPVGLLDWHRVMRLAGTVDVVHAHGHQAAVVAAIAVTRARPRPRLFVSLHNDLPSVAPAPVPYAAPYTAAAQPPTAAPKTTGSPGATGTASPPTAGRRDAPWGRAGRSATQALLSWCLGRAQLVTGASPDLVELARSLGARRVELALVPSPAVADLLDAGPLAPAERERLLASAGLPADQPVVLTVARIAPQKDLPTLVAAARRSRVPASWVVVGDGDERLRARLEQEAAGIRQGEHAVHFVGARADVHDWLRASDVFVLTSRWEARALVVQEAMAAALPVVATRTGGLPELVSDAGTLVPVGDPVSVAAEVDLLLDDPTVRERMGAAARLRASSWPTPEDEARRWVERYAADAPGMT
ncbi:glycosyltransferase family 4 protein [Terrabacter sp. NPDC080008]|uniref:glycosyltransferase family 4 protein n=1 Tax=Terrabacter sp. NPDC080008 TaxID=3155176 RepID=UPI0034501988